MVTSNSWMACIDVERFSSCTIPVRAVPKARHYYFQSLARKLQIISLELLADWNLAGTASVAWYAAGPPHYAATWTRSGLCQKVEHGSLDCTLDASTSTEAFVPIPSGVNETIHALQFANPKQFENYSMNWLVRRVMDAALSHFESVVHELHSSFSCSS